MLELCLDVGRPVAELGHAFGVHLACLVCVHWKRAQSLHEEAGSVILQVQELLILCCMRSRVLECPR